MLKDLAAVDRMFHALGDPTRRAMVERLAGGPMSVSALAAPFPMSLPAIVQHLKLLEESGLVRSQKVGRVRTCRVEPAGLKAAGDWIAAQRAEWEGRLDRLEAYLEETETGNDQ